jgi:hypothetical protein
MNNHSRTIENTPSHPFPRWEFGKGEACCHFITPTTLWKDESTAGAAVVAQSKLPKGSHRYQHPNG